MTMAAQAPQDTLPAPAGAGPANAPGSPVDGPARTGEKIAPAEPGEPAAPPPAVRPTDAATNVGNAAVQLGAFSTAANANNAWTQLASKFPAELQGLTPQILSVVSSGRSLYRLQTRVADEAAARRLCRQLQQRAQGCLPAP